MSTNKSNRRGRPATGRKPTTTVSVRVDPALGKAIDAYLDSQRPAPTVTRLVETAIEDFLTAKGFWPPAGTN